MGRIVSIDYGEVRVGLAMSDMSNTIATGLDTLVINKDKKKIVQKIISFALDLGLYAEKITKAPIRKGKNVEYLVLFNKGINIKYDINKLIKSTEF